MPTGPFWETSLSGSSGSISYEIQTFLGGAWKIDSVYDDRSIAVYEAQRVHAGGRYSAVRVVEERFDAASGKIVSKTVFRAAKADAENAEAIERQKTVRHEVEAARKATGAGEFNKGPGQRPAKKSGPGAVTLTLILGAIALAGIGLMVGLQYLFGKL